MVKEYQKGTRVYTYYFDYDTNELICKELVVLRYDYLDGCQWSIIDEYTLEEEIIEKKYYFFKKKKAVKHTIVGHLISDNREKAKLRFLHNFLTTFVVGERTPDKIIALNKIAKMYYEEMIETNPEIVLSGLTEKLVSDNKVQYYWR